MVSNKANQLFKQQTKVNKMYTLTKQTETVLNANKNALRALCKQHGIKNYGKLNNAQMRNAVNQKAAVSTMLQQAVKQNAKVVEVETPVVNSWVTMLAPATTKQAATAAKVVVTKKPVKRQPVQNGQRQPKVGGKTYAVWVQMHYALNIEKLPLKQAKQYVREHFVGSNVHFNTVNAQIYRYCKFHGLTK